MVAGGALLVLGDWIWAQVDAVKTANRKNRENRYLTWKLGKEDATLALQPNFKFVPKGSSVTPDYSMALNLKF